MEKEIHTFGNQVPGVAYKIRPGSYAVILGRQSDVLLVKAPRGWYLPGGGGEPGETPEQTLDREVFEETGLVLGLRKYLGVADELVFSKEENTYFRKRCTFFLAEIKQAQGPGENDHPGFWSPLVECGEMGLCGSQIWALEKALEVFRREHR